MNTSTPTSSTITTRMLEQRVCKAQKTQKIPLQRSTEATNLNPIGAVIPFVAQAWQRWQ